MHPPVPHHPPMPPAIYSRYALVSAKNPALHALASAFLLPGLGSMLAGQVGMGFLLAGLFLASAVITVLLAMTIVGLLIAWLPLMAALALWAVSIWHAHYSAVEWNRRRGIVS